MRPSEALAAQRERIVAIAAANGATNVRVFGCAAKGADRADSDLDLLVDIPPGESLRRIVGLQLAIEDARGVRVDLRTGRELHPQLKDKILAAARPLRPSAVPCTATTRAATKTEDGACPAATSIALKARQTRPTS
jgi:hypothetical protein